MPRRGSACDDDKPHRQLEPSSSAARRARPGDRRRRRRLHRARLPFARLRRRRLSRRRVSPRARSKRRGPQQRLQACPESTAILKRCSTILLSKLSTSPCLPSSSRRSSTAWSSAHRRVRGILAQKPLAMSYAEASRVVAACARAGVLLQVNQNMRYDQSVRALKSLIDDRVLGEPVLATIEMRAIPHWMPWARERPVAFDLRDEHPPSGHLPLLAGRPRSRALEHPTRPAHSLPPRRRHQPVHSRIRVGSTCFRLGRRLGRARARGGRIRNHRQLAVRGDRGAGLGHDRLARLARTGSPAPSTIPPSATRATGIARAGRKPGFPTPSPARWEACSTPSKPARNPISPASTT